jgi:periplasmic protein TonB
MSVIKGNALSRSGGVVIAVAIHLLLIYVVATSLGIVKVPNFVKPMEAVIIDSPQEPQKFEPVETKPDLAKPDLQVEQTIPEIPVEVPIEEAPPAEAVTTSPAPPAPAEVASLSVKNRVDPPYPAQSRRAGEEGTVTVRVLVDPNGRPSDVSVAQSSGHPRLDQAAMEAIKKWRFAAAVQGGSAVAAYTTVKVTFRLDQAQ